MEERPVILTFETAKTMYESKDGVLMSIASKTFPELLNSDFPKSWEELCKIKEGNIGYCIDTCGNTLKTSFENHHNYQNTISTEERANRLLLLGQLLEIRDEWNRIDKFIPNWSSTDNKYSIRLVNKTLIVLDYMETYHLFTFKTQERAIKFIKTFEKELLQILSI